MASSPNRMLGVVVGAVYLIIGAAGFVVTSGVGPVDADGGLLFGIFAVNPLHNVAHLVVGAALLGAGIAGVRPARAANIAVGTAYLGLGMFGLFAIGTPANVLAINGADNVLHFASATLLLAVGLGAERERQPAST